MGRLRGTLTHCLRNPSFGLRRGHATRCLQGGRTRTYADLNFAYDDIHMARLLHSMMTGVLERTQLYAGACILYSICLFKRSLLSRPTSQNGGRRGRLFLVSMLGLTTSRDGFCVILPWHNAAEQTLSRPTL